MDNTYVILAAGRGSRIGRIGDSLHKALVPLKGAAMLTHLIRLAPPRSKIVIAIGYLGQQIRDYVALAHPLLHVDFVDVQDWDQPGAGPGTSLLACRSLVEGDLTIVPCDTLWTEDRGLWHYGRSWVGVAPVPPGTHLSRWCRVRCEGDDQVIEFIDKSVRDPDCQTVYTGLTRIHGSDLDIFWNGLRSSKQIAGERQLSNGLKAVAQNSMMMVRTIEWTDTGDEQSYRQAVSRFSGYDWSKPGQATYVLPEEGRVIKFNADVDAVERRFARQCTFTGGVPKVVGAIKHMLAYDYVPGVSAYQASESLGVEVAERVRDWHLTSFTKEVSVPIATAWNLAETFYRHKTMNRIAKLPLELQYLAQDALEGIDWDEIVHNIVPVVWHGDLNYSNIIMSPGGIIAIDWREDFAGETGWGDMRYDLAKLIVGCYTHWDRAQRGDMTIWDEGAEHAEVFRSGRMYHKHRYAIEVIAGLTMLNSAPLHAPPFDEVLVARGAAWLRKAVM